MLAVTFRKVNRPRVLFPATFSSTVVVPGYCRLIVLGAPFPENDIFTRSSCAQTPATPRLNIVAIRKSVRVMILVFIFLSSLCVETRANHDSFGTVAAVARPTEIGAEAPKELSVEEMAKTVRFRNDGYASEGEHE